MIGARGEARSGQEPESAGGGIKQFCGANHVSTGIDPAQYQNCAIRKQCGGMPSTRDIQSGGKRGSLSVPRRLDERLGQRSGLTHSAQQQPASIRQQSGRLAWDRAGSGRVHGGAGDRWLQRQRWASGTHFAGARARRRGLTCLRDGRRVEGHHFGACSGVVSNPIGGTQGRRE